MKFFTIFLATVFCSAAALASVVTAYGEKVTVPHQRLHLTNEQILEICDGQLTLTDQQLAKLRKKCPNFPRTVYGILTSFPHECTCCIGCPYVIVLPGGESVLIEDSQLKELKGTKNFSTSSKGRDGMLSFLHKSRKELARRGVVLPPCKWNFYNNGSLTEVAISGSERHGFDTLYEALRAVPASKRVQRILFSFETLADKTIENEIRNWLEKNLPDEYRAAMVTGGEGIPSYNPDRQKGDPNVVAIQKSLGEAIRAIPSMKKTFRLLTKKGYRVEKISDWYFSIAKNPDGTAEFRGSIYISLDNKKAPPAPKK